MKKLPFRQTLLAAAVPVLLSPLAHAGVGFGITTDPGFTTAGNPAYPTYTMPTFYANSDFPSVTGGVFTPGLHKFVDTLAPLGCGTAALPTTNNLGQCIPVAVPSTPYTTVSYPGTDYYEIGIVEYTERMHSDLPATSAAGAAVPTYTHLRGYVQLVPSTYPDAVALTEADGVTALVRNGVAFYGASKPHYLGPVIVATKGKPVRVKYTNLLPAGKATNTAGTGAPTIGVDAAGYNKVSDFKRNGDLFIPVDDTLTGAGLGPTVGAEAYRQNRAEIHLHGGHSPWISDGTPHQWTVPLGDTAAVYQKGAAFQNVPDMADPGQGSGTLFWTNDQSARLMFYHDHTEGETRLNVYVGEAAGYALTDPAEDAILAASMPAAADTIPLIIQDKTFVPKDVAMQDAKWDTNAWGKPGDLWFPHVYETNQDPASADGTNPVGRWDWGPWFWPVFSSSFGLPSGEYGVNNVTTTPEAFMDTPLVNGTAYPKLQVQPKAYRFRVLNASNDRFWNLGLYQAEPLSIGLASAGTGYTNPLVTISAPPAGGTQATADALFGITDISFTGQAIDPLTGSAGYTVPPTVTIGAPPAGGIQATAVALLEPIAAGAPGTYIKSILVTNPGDGYTVAPSITITAAGGDTAPTLTGTATVGLAGIRVSNPGSGYVAAPTVTITDPTGTGAVAVASVNTEVHLVPFSTGYTAPATVTPNGHPSFPITGGLQGTGWGQMDNRLGGVPDPATAGPDIIQIGNESGLLPNAVTIPSTPINYEYNKRSVTVLNTLERGLFLGNAERADVVIDFSQYAGKTLILYNDAPAPVPASDPRIDYYTGNPDMTDSGGAPSTLPGYGPNTRTVMKIEVAAAVPAAPFDSAKLAANLPLAYKATQAEPIVPEPAYAPAFGASTDPTNYAGINIGTNQVPYFAFTTGGAGGTGAPVASLSVKTGGTGYKTAPAVAIAAPGCAPLGTATCAQATATSTVTGGMVTGFTMTANGAGYTAAPSVVLSGGGGIGGSATANLASVAGGPVTKTYPVYNKAIQELFEPTFGRMNATLGVEMPLTSNLNQTTVPLAYIDPVTETVNPGEVQIWKITHNGVDTHPVHFHLVDVQVINRVGWDGTLKEPYANEVGWKETVKMNPLEDIIVAVKARAVDTSAFGFGLPQSQHLLDPTQAANSTLGFTQVNLTGTPIAVSTNADGTVKTDPITGAIIANPGYNANFGLAVGAGTVKNVMTNFDNEYVWHCHILGHEENDFMRSLVFHPATTPVVAPTITAPVNNTLVAASSAVNVTWIDNSTSEYKYVVERAVNGGAFSIRATLPANSTSYAAGNIPANTSWTFRVTAFGASNTASASSTVTTNALSAATWAAAPVLPVNMLTFQGYNVAGSQVLLSFIDNALLETTYRVEQCYNNCGSAASWLTVPAANVSYSGPVGAGVGPASLTVSTALQQGSYRFRITPMNGGTAGTVSANSSAMSTTSAPSTPSGLSAVKNGSSAVLSWTDTANNNAGDGTLSGGYVIQVRRMIPGTNVQLQGWANTTATPVLLGNAQTTTLSYAVNIPANMKPVLIFPGYYQFRIASTGPGGMSNFTGASSTVTLP